LYRELVFFHLQIKINLVGFSSNLLCYIKKDLPRPVDSQEKHEFPRRSCVWCCHLLYVFTTKKGNSIWLFMIWVFCKINMTKWLYSSQLQSHSFPLLSFLLSKQFYFSQRFPILSNHSEGITDYTTCPAILKFEVCFWTHIPTIRLKISMW